MLPCVCTHIYHGPLACVWNCSRIPCALQDPWYHFCLCAWNKKRSPDFHIFIYLYHDILYIGLYRGYESFQGWPKMATILRTAFSSAFCFLQNCVHFILCCPCDQPFGAETGIFRENYRKISNIRRTKSPNLNVSRHILQLSLPNPMKLGVKLRMKM